MPDSIERPQSAQHGPQASAPALPRNERRRVARDLNVWAETVRRRIGHAPAPDALHRLNDDLLSAGAITPDQHAKAQATGWLDHDDEAHRLVAFGRLVDLSRDALAAKAVDFLGLLFQSGDRFELASLSPTGAGRATLGGTWPADRDRAAAWLRDRIGWQSLYFGAQPRAVSWQGTAAAKAGDVVEHRTLALDFDRQAGEDAGAWNTRRADLVSKLTACGPVGVLDTGGGVQAHFRLDPVSDPAEMSARAARLNALAAELGSDRVCDLPRITRLPWTVNVPDKRKLAKGRHVALARALHADANAPVHDEGTLTAALRAAFGVSADGGTPAVSGAPDGAASSAPTADPAPSMDALRDLLAHIPNQGPRFAARDAWVAVGHAIRGASSGSAEGRALWRDWSASWDGGGDPTEAERAWDSFKDTRTGWTWLVRLATDIDGAAAAIGFDTMSTDSAPDIARMVANVERAAANGNGRAGPLERAVAALSAAGVAPFRSTDGRTCARWQGRCLDLSTGRDQAVVLAHLSKAHGIVLNKAQRATLIDHFDALAADAPAQPVHVQAAVEGTAGGFATYIDRGDDTGRVFRVGAAGWQEVDGATVPVNLIRGSGAQPLPAAAPGGGAVPFLDRFAAHVNLPPVVSPTDPLDIGVQARAAVLVLLTGISLPLGPVMHGDIQGPQGSGKTIAADRIKRLVDPNAAMVTHGTSDPRELFIIARTGRALVLDNISDVSATTSDALCCLATGASLAKRRLYADGEVSVLQARCCVLLTSISPDLIWRGDLAQRTVHVPLRPPAQRRAESVLTTAWEQEHPGLLAAWLDILAGALARLPGLLAAPGGHRSRMADAVAVGEAAAQACGWPAGLLTDAIETQQRQAARDLLAADPVVLRLERVLAAHGGTWLGSATDLWTAIDAVGGPPWFGAGKEPRPRSMTAWVQRHEDDLRTARGWRVDTGEHLRAKDAGRARRVLIDARTDADPVTTTTEDDAGHPF